ncbi:hypothetical protein CSC66_17030 [Pseudoxanthomonas kaohsiungensis]|nr:hypothetical protein CSC66_17030 [Pseudoxanthomonas kaohsiungensis]
MFVLSAEGWAFNEAADRRFRRISTVVGIIFVILAVIIPFLELLGVQEGGGETTDTTYVNILPDAEIAEQVEEPKPAEEEKPEPEPVKEVKKPKKSKNLTHVPVEADLRRSHHMVLPDYLLRISVL